MLEVKGERSIPISGYFNDLIPKRLSDLDRMAFQSHVLEIEKLKGMEFREWIDLGWEWKKQIITNYCNRTGVSFDRLMHYVLCPWWKQIEMHLRRIDKI